MVDMKLEVELEVGILVTGLPYHHDFEKKCFLFLKSVFFGGEPQGAPIRVLEPQWAQKTTMALGRSGSHGPQGPQRPHLAPHDPLLLQALWLLLTLLGTAN